LISASTLSPSVTAHVAHVVAETRNPQALSIVPRARRSRPHTDLGVNRRILQEPDHDFALATHAGSDVSELPVTVG
jgi:hypothetical protein